MKTRLILFISLLGYSVILFSCGGKSEEKPALENKKEQKLQLVKVQTVETSTFTDNFKVVGVVKPFASAKVSSEEGGLITYVLNKGARVGTGTTVVRLNKDVDKATYEQLLAQYEIAKMNYEKQEMLWNEKATTEIQYQTSKWQMESAGRSLDVLRTRIRKQYVRSPISGVVEEKYMNKGEMSAPGSPILYIIEISSVKITAGIPEKYVNQIQKGQSVMITADALPGVEFEGKVNYIGSALSTANRTFEVEVVISNKERILKPEMSVNVEIAKTTNNNAVSIIQDYIIDMGQEKYVFILDGDVARKRVVTIGGRNDNMVMIESGLNPGEKLIIEGYQSISDGEKIQVLN